MKDIRIFIQGFSDTEVIREYISTLTPQGIITPEQWGEYLMNGVPINVYIDWLKKQAEKQESCKIDKYLKTHEIVRPNNLNNENNLPVEITQLIKDINEKISASTIDFQKLNELIDQLKQLLERWQDK